MTDYELGAYVTFALWGLAFCALVRIFGLARALSFIGTLFFLAVRLMLGFVRAFRTD